MSNCNTQSRTSTMNSISTITKRPWMRQNKLLQKRGPYAKSQRKDFECLVLSTVNLSLPRHWRPTRLKNQQAKGKSLIVVRNCLKSSVSRTKELMHNQRNHKLWIMRRKKLKWTSRLKICRLKSGTKETILRSCKNNLIRRRMRGSIWNNQMKY